METRVQIRRLLLSLCATLICVSPQRAAAQNQAGPQTDDSSSLATPALIIVRIDVDTPEGRVALKEAGLESGVAATRKRIRAALKHLHRSGVWANAQVYQEAVEGGVVLRVELAPRTVVQVIEWVGSSYDEEELRRVIDLAPGEEISTEGLAKIPSQIEGFYASQGYDEVKVHAEILETQERAHKILRIHVREGQPTVVSRVIFKLASDQDYLPQDLRRLEGLSIGDRLSDKALEEAVRETEKRIRRHGYYEAEVVLAAVQRDEHHATITVNLHTGPLYVLEFSGYRPFARSDLFETLEVTREPLSEAALRGFEERLEAFYRQRGYLDADVQVATARLPPHQPAPQYPPTARSALQISVTTGPQWRVTSMTFPGAAHIEVDDLQDRIELYLSEDLPGSDFLSVVDSAKANAAGAGANREIRRDGERPAYGLTSLVFHEPSYEDAISSIREMYQAEGFLSVQVGPMRATRHHPVLGTSDRHEITVEIPIVEGPRTMLHSLKFVGLEQAMGRELAQVSGLERGQPFSEIGLEQARIRIADHYREQGFFFARVDSVTRFSDDRLRAEVIFEVVEGFVAHIADVEVRGNDFTSSSLIIDRAGLEKGDLLTPSALTKAQDQLLALGVFTSVTVTPRDAELPEKRKTIELAVTERKRIFIDVQPGFSTGDGLRATIEGGHRNVLGYALGIRGRAQVGYQVFFVDDQIERRIRALPDIDRLERNLSAGIALPYFPLIDNTSLSLSAANVRDNERDFGYDKWGSTLALVWRPARRFSATIAEDLEWNSVDLFVDSKNIEDFLQTNPDPRLRRILRVPDGISIILATRLRIAFDLRDNPFLARRGFYISAGGEYARTLETENNDPNVEPFFSHFIKAGFTFNGYVPIDTVVLAIQLRIGRIFHLEENSKTYPNRAYFLGGTDTLRGFFQDALIPQDLADEIASGSGLTANDIVRGGDAYALLRTELRFPIWGNLYGGAFVDLGNSWADPDRLLEGLKLRPTAGLGLRFQTPVGFIALDYGINVLRRRELAEGFGALHFAIGLF